MRESRRAIVALMAGATLAALGFGMAVAQDSQDSGDFAASGSGETPEVGTEIRAGMTSEEMVAEARRIVDQGEQLSRQMLSNLDEARRDGDIIRVTCVNDKLTQVNAHRSTVEQRLENLEDAIQGADISRRNHEYTVIVVIGQHLVSLDQEALACIGEDIFETGTTQVTTTVDTATPVEDTSLVPTVQESGFAVPTPSCGTI